MNGWQPSLNPNGVDLHSETHVKVTCLSIIIAKFLTMQSINSGIWALLACSSRFTLQAWKEFRKGSKRWRVETLLYVQML